MEQEPHSGDPLLPYINALFRSMGSDRAGDATPQPSPEQMSRVGDIEATMEYIAEARVRSFGAFFGSITNDDNENLRAGDEDDLASYDTSDAAQSMAFEVGISTEYLKPSLEKAGLGVSGTNLNPQLFIADGERLTAFLKELPHASETMRAGIVEMLNGTFGTIMLAHVPSMYDESYDTYHKYPRLLPEVNAGIELADSYGPQTDQAILHAAEIAKAMRRPEMDEKIATKLELLHAADREGKLGEWSVAFSWGLYNSPDSAMSSEWQQWFTGDEWQKLFEFMDGAAARSPEGSPFLRELIDRLSTNITNYRNGDVVQIERPASPVYEDDEIFIEPDEIHPDPAESSTYLSTEHDALLEQALERLRLYRV